VSQFVNVGFKEQGAIMKLQSAFKLLLASSVAACCVVPAYAQIVDTELSGTISSLQGGGWSNSDFGQSVTLDFAYDAAAQTSSFNNGIFILSAPITSASFVGGGFGRYQAVGRQVFTGVPFEDLKLTMEKILSGYLRGREKSESFQAFTARHDLNQLQAIFSNEE